MKIVASVLAREAVLGRVSALVALVPAALAGGWNPEQGMRGKKTACTMSKGRRLLAYTTQFFMKACLPDMPEFFAI